jgi:crotonobetainyl-CoA hydratase
MPITTSTSADGTVLEVVLDRPKANTIDATTSRELSTIFDVFNRDTMQRVAIFTGAGEKFFSAGWDLNAANEGEAFDSDYGVGGFGGFPELPNRNKPIIAAVNGMAVGGGFELALAADFIVAAEHSQFFLPETRVGVLPDSGTVRLPRLLPRQLSNEIIFAGRRLSALEAQSWGIVNRVVPSVELMESARQLAAEICLSAPLSVAAVLELNRTLEHVDIHDAMHQMRKNPAYRRAVDSQDALEGPASFAEKRPPRWQGK